jgi:hypothetical protein
VVELQSDCFGRTNPPPFKAPSIWQNEPTIGWRIDALREVKDQRSQARMVLSGFSDAIFRNEWLNLLFSRRIEMAVSN